MMRPPTAVACSVLAAAVAAVAWAYGQETNVPDAARLQQMAARFAARDRTVDSGAAGSRAYPGHRIFHPRQTHRDRFVDRTLQRRVSERARACGGAAPRGGEPGR